MVAATPPMASVTERGQSDDETICGKTANHRPLIRVLRIVGYLAFVYVATYALMMNPHGQAWDVATWTPVYDSSFYFAPTAHPRHLRNCYLPMTCWANRIFWPMDYVVPPLLKLYEKRSRQRGSDEQRFSRVRVRGAVAVWHSFAANVHSRVSHPVGCDKGCWIPPYPRHDFVLCDVVDARLAAAYFSSGRVVAGETAAAVGSGSDQLVPVPADILFLSAAPAATVLAIGCRLLSCVHNAGAVGEWTTAANQRPIVAGVGGSDVCRPALCVSTMLEIEGGGFRLASGHIYVILKLAIWRTYHSNGTSERVKSTGESTGCRLKRRRRSFSTKTRKPTSTQTIRGKKIVSSSWGLVSGFVCS